LFDMRADPHQYNNLVDSPDHQQIVEDFQTKLVEKLQAVRSNDLGIDTSGGR